MHRNRGKLRMQVRYNKLRVFFLPTLTCYSMTSVFNATSGDLTADTLIGTNIEIFKEYEISIDLKIDPNPSSVDNNVFQFRAPHVAKTIGSRGDRIPAVYQQANSNRLLTYNFISGKDYNIDVDVAANEWFNMKIAQVNYQKNSKIFLFQIEDESGKFTYSVSIDDFVVDSVINRGPRSWTKVEATLGRSKDTDGTTKGVPTGSYRNLKLTSKFFLLKRL